MIYGKEKGRSWKGMNGNWDYGYESGLGAVVGLLLGGARSWEKATGMGKRVGMRMARWIQGRGVGKRRLGWEGVSGREWRGGSTDEGNPLMEEPWWINITMREVSSSCHLLRLHL